MRELLVGTKKGLFVLRGEQPDALAVAARAFEGDVVEFAMRDPRTRSLLRERDVRLLRTPVMWTDDPLRRVAGSEGARLPGRDRRRRRPDLGRHAGEATRSCTPASLRPHCSESRDEGASWSLNEPLWNERIAGDWNRGSAGSPALDLSVARATRSSGARGVARPACGRRMTAASRGPPATPACSPLPAGGGSRGDPRGALCVHNMHRAPTAPERLFMQFHGSVYRSDDAGSSWNEIAAGLPSGFGFPLGDRPGGPRPRVRDPHERPTSTG